MTRWIVLAVPVAGVADMDREAQTVAEFEGNAEEAAAALLEAATGFEHGRRKARRREVFKASDRSYFVRLQGRLSTYGFLIQLAELVHDTDSAPGAHSEVASNELE
ncbi:hypothetical protein ABZ372_44220 [Streptomyces sp. NPDC005921]|uniref:hypothetical protein n=1 Tax=Streptomyces sp. NPDC005827 TaxID=3157070 RepID=UPI003404EF75